MQCSPVSTEESVGLFMLRKDSERRETLHRVLTDYNDLVVLNIQESVPEVGGSLGAENRHARMGFCHPGRERVIGLDLTSVRRRVRKSKSETICGATQQNLKKGFKKWSLNKPQTGQ